MKIDRAKYSRFLESVAEAIDIPPSKYRDAVQRYQAVGGWLENGQYPGCMGIPSVYPQGSFRIGTVVRPIRGGVEADYDIDLVCQLLIPKHHTDPRSVKLMVGQRLFDHGRYRQQLDKEGRRCWTLLYAEEDGIGFHLDVLPSVSEWHELAGAPIAITNKDGNTYSWSTSNPKGYAEWFDDRNRGAFQLVEKAQKQSVQSRASTVYASVDDVPDQLVRTPLQRSIQIMKRHRDSTFNDGKTNEYAPISIIITTLAAQLYRQEVDVLSALTGIISRIQTWSPLIENQPGALAPVPSELISRTSDGKWYIGNPVNPNENFADRWHEENHARARAFFAWVKTLTEDILEITTSTRVESVRDRLMTTLGASVVSSHIGLIVPAPVVPTSPPRIRIPTPVRPWGAK